MNGRNNKTCFVAFSDAEKKEVNKGDVNNIHISDTPFTLIHRHTSHTSIGTHTCAHTHTHTPLMCILNPKRPSRIVVENKVLANITLACYEAVISVFLSWSGPATLTICILSLVSTIKKGHLQLFPSRLNKPRCIETWLWMDCVGI